METDYRAKHESLIGQMADIVNNAQAQKRNLTEAERDEFSRLEGLSKQLASLARIGNGSDSVPETRGSGNRDAEMRAYEQYLRTADTRSVTGWTTSTTDGTGDNAGFTVPQDFWVNFQVALKAYGGVLTGAKVLETTDGRVTPWPTVDPTTFVGHIVSTEITQEATIQPLTVGQGVLNAWTYTPGGPILISKQLAQDSAFDIVGFVQERTAEAIGRALAAHAVSGTGSGQPQGIIPALNARGAWTAGSSGGFINLTAATTVKTFATSAPSELVGNLLAPQTLINMVQAIDPAYYMGCKWYFNAAQAWNLRTVVDSNGRPLINFANGFDADAVTGADYNSNAPVGKLFGFPVVIDNNIPNLTPSTTGGPVFGDLSKAMVYRTVRDMNQMVLHERYADSLAIGVYTYYRADVRSNDLRAAVTVKPAGT